ncbi:hypothetical protein J7T55_007237 [Diaporthe amygdali]|uniref:uncharacterized protein n=1 Tax=Phomopsis amygdali TaxID=1214568 RepID=UPI0022FEF8F5|nr:uncharacterized protein J7T55_007237 [Diaporthe amygdali]KAJ0108118.1 hypothetical protein J7T55_007237 [Diaporthe amygdali]
MVKGMRPHSTDANIATKPVDGDLARLVVDVVDVRVMQGSIGVVGSVVGMITTRQESENAERSISVSLGVCVSCLQSLFTAPDTIWGKLFPSTPAALLAY